MSGIYIVLAIVIFGLLIAVHELGHFLVAKLCGVRVNEFAIGMGPAIIKKKHGDTTYALRIIPIGGYCAMEGEDGESDHPHSFSGKPLWARFLVVVAGSVMNLLSGVIVIAILFAPTSGWSTPELVEVEDWSYLAESGVRAGDEILSIDGYRVILSNDIFLGLERGKNAPYYELELLRDGEKITLDNVRFEKKGEKYGISLGYEKSSFLKKTGFVFKNAYNLVRMIRVGIFDLISGNASAKDMAGPIGISQVMVETAKTSMPSLWFLVAFISINLGIMNLLPLPALDGGRILFLLLELIRRKQINPKHEGYVHLVGFILLIALMLFVTFNDIVRLFA